MDSDLYHMIPSGSRSERVAEVLMELITSKKLSAGDFLPSEAELCRRLGVSRPTIRQALGILETRGLILTRHGVGAQVTDRTRDVVTASIRLMLLHGGHGPRDLLEVRQMLECQMAALAATRATDDDIRALVESIAVIGNQSSTVDEYVAADLNFHLRLAEASKNAVLLSLVHAIRGLLHDVIAATYAIDGQTERRLRDHTRILDAIVARDPTGADAAMQAHLRSTEAMLRQLRMLQPFEGDYVGSSSVTHVQEKGVTTEVSVR